MDSFLESLNRLKDIHEKEVLSLQNKLLELNSDRCRDAQRVEELCAKNRQLREQQKALKDNIRVLENRLRAGLCDRCTVTQELARKKQQEFESSLLQSLQRVFLLTSEMNRLQEENETLKEEVTRLRGLGPKSQCREGTSGPSSPPLLSAPGARKATAEKLPGGQEAAGDHHPEKLGYRMSPVAKISPSASLPEPPAPDMSPQRISNQLHGTIAVVRPGARACSTDRGSANGTPSARGSPPSPPYEYGLPLDSFLRASRPSTVTFEALTHPVQADRHLSMRLRSPHSSPRAPAAAPGGPRLQGMKPREAEAWEGPPGLRGLPGTLVDMRDPRLEGALSLFLAQQLRARGQDGSARPRGPPRTGKTLPSPPVSSDSDGSEGEVPGAALPGRRCPQPTGPGSPRAKEATATQDHVPDKPLDLSERGRGRDAPTLVIRPGSLSPRAAHTPSPEPPRGAEPPAQSGPRGCSDGARASRAPGPEQARTPEDTQQPLPGPRPGPASPDRTADECRERPELLPPADGRAGDELGKAQVQRPAAEQLDEPGAEDGEGLSPEAAAAPSTWRQGAAQKRKRAASSPGPWDKASKKPSRGRGSPRRGPGPEDGSPSPGSSS